MIFHHRNCTLFGPGNSSSLFLSIHPFILSYECFLVDGDLSKLRKWTPTPFLHVAHEYRALLTPYIRSMNDYVYISSWKGTSAPINGEEIL